MNRVFELDEVMPDDVIDTWPFKNLTESQRQPWGDGVLYRTISELEVPDNPITEPLVLNVWYQADPEAAWVLME